MPFPPHQRAAMLCFWRASPTLVSRLEELGFESLRMLSQVIAREIVARETARENDRAGRGAVISGQSPAGIKTGIR